MSGFDTDVVKAERKWALSDVVYPAILSDLTYKLKWADCNPQLFSDYSMFNKLSEAIRQPFVPREGRLADTSNNAAGWFVERIRRRQN